MVNLGLQDTTRKQRPNYQTPGEWTGSMKVLLENTGLCVNLSEKKWGRVTESICNMLAKFNHADNFPEMNLKNTEQKRLGPAQDVHFFYM